MTQELIERLRKMAKQSSEASRMMAQSKSLRQAGHSPPSDDLYMWATPEQTTEWQAANALQSQSARIAELEGAANAMIAANSAARAMIPDEEEGLAAQVFAYHINAADMELRASLENDNAKC